MFHKLNSNNKRRFGLYYFARREFLATIYICIWIMKKINEINHCKNKKWLTNNKSLTRAKTKMNTFFRFDLFYQREKKLVLIYSDVRVMHTTLISIIKRRKNQLSFCTYSIGIHSWYRIIVMSLLLRVYTMFC